MNPNTAQKLIREVGPEYLEQHPVGVTNTLARLTKRFTPVEWRKPKARKPNEFDEPPVCPECNGDKQIWSAEYQEEYDCNKCDGKGFLTFEQQPCVFIHVYRDFHSIECEVQIKEGKIADAFVTVSEGDYKAGETIELTINEQDEALRAITEASTGSNPQTQITR